jgi:protein SCO1/2
MSRRALALVFVPLLIAACSRSAPAREYELRGQILGIEPERSEVLLKHEDIKGFMPGMTMPFKVEDARLLEGKQPGDLVTATLVVGEVQSHLSTLTTTGHAALEKPPLVGDTPRILAPGEMVADALLVDQDGKPLPFSNLRGHRVGLTFIYTRCPLVEFCPTMELNFRTVQQMVKSTPALSDVRLLAMTLDPAFDTPAVLKPHAESRGADPAVWSFVTAEPKTGAQFASQFGLYVERTPGDDLNIIHNLVTVIVDASGRLVKLHTGNRWKPAELVADLKAAAAPAH